MEDGHYLFFVVTLIIIILLAVFFFFGTYNSTAAVTPDTQKQLVEVLSLTAKAATVK